MNLKYFILIALLITIILFLLSIYKIITYKNDNMSYRYPLRRKNALTEEEFNSILKKMNKGKNLN